MRPEPAVINGWNLYTHPAFKEYMRKLALAVGKIRERNPESWQRNNIVSLYKAILRGEAAPTLELAWWRCQTILPIVVTGRETRWVRHISTGSKLSLPIAIDCFSAMIATVESLPMSG